MSERRDKISKKSATLERSNNLNDIGEPTFSLKLAHKLPSCESFDGAKTKVLVQSNEITQESLDNPEDIFKSTPSLLPLNVQIRPSVPFNNSKYFALDSEFYSE